MGHEDDQDKEYSRMMRVGSFVAGIGFLGLAAADAMFDPFPGPETFFAGTGVSLIVIGATGKSPNPKDDES